jgi:hypothetical protein
MPKGPPPPDHIIGRKAAFFSIDTNVLEGKGFDFNHGELNVLHLQRPAWMTLQLSDIVEREVYAHRMRDLTEAKDKLDAALKHMRRKAALNVTKVVAELDALAVIETARNQFKTELQSFVTGLGGDVLPTNGDALVGEMFDRYFALQAPFEVLKKTEFPDAAALLVLERYAKDQDIFGVLISNDGGWHSFATKSEHLYCAKSLKDFTNLFEALTDHAKELLAKIRADVEELTSDCYEMVSSAIERHVTNASWMVEEIYSGYSHRVEGEIWEINVVDFELDLASMQGWFTEADETLYVVEIPALVNVQVAVSAEFFQYDSIDRDEVSLGSRDVMVNMAIDVSVFLTSTGELMTKPVNDWEMEVEIAAGDYRVDVGEVNIDFGYDEDHDPDRHYGLDPESGQPIVPFDDKAKPLP